MKELERRKASTRGMEGKEDSTKRRGQRTLQKVQKEEILRIFLANIRWIQVSLQLPNEGNKHLSKYLLPNVIYLQHRCVSFMKTSINIFQSPSRLFIAHLIQVSNKVTHKVTL